MGRHSWDEYDCCMLLMTPELSGDDLCPPLHLSSSIYRLDISPPSPERQILPLRLDQSYLCYAYTIVPKRQ